MQIVLRQVFPLGRFHATPWRANPFDDPYGEWPPSPWRLVRAVVARWYQWNREMGDGDAQSLERLTGAFCRSNVSFFLPVEARRGRAFRQYQPVEFSWKPPENKKGTIPQEKVYGTTLVQDNYWAVPPATPLWWFLDGDEWSDELLDVLDRCLERIVYFGRAETLTEVRRWPEPDLTPNCELARVRRSRDDVPVLAPVVEATLDQIQCITDQRDVRGSTVPPGAVWKFAHRPPAVPLRLAPRVSVPSSTSRHLMQFAITGAVLPEMRTICRVTRSFRQRALKHLVRPWTGNAAVPWRQAPVEARKQAVLLSGFDPQKGRLKNHEHAWFLVWPEAGVPARLLVWRSGPPFTVEEQRALLAAAEGEISWGTVPGRGEWTVRLLPLDAAVPPPPGFEGQSCPTWQTVTPYVPPRHRFRHGKPRAGEDVASQLLRELEARGWRAAHARIDVLSGPKWTAVHLPPGQKRSRPFIGDRAGFDAKIEFGEPVKGPIILGHSGHFGLGLFAPAVAAAASPASCAPASS